MIQINMLKQRPIILGIVSEKDGVRLLVTVLLIVIIASVTTALLLKKKTVTEEAGIKPFENSSAVVEPTTVADSGMLVDSVKNTSVSDTLLTRYSDLNMAQRLTYEHLFAYYLFRELTLIVPSDVDFTNISMSGYERVIGMGGISSEASTIALFSALKQKGWDLEPKPASLFREVQGGFQFRFEGLYQMKPAAIDSLVITESSIPTQAHLQSLKDSTVACIARSPVQILGELENLEPEVEGKYRHYHYSISGKSSFTQFKDLLKEMKNNALPISVSSAELNASGSELEWKITVRITVL